MSGRGYRLKEGEEVDSGIRRVAAGRAEKAIEHLRDEAAGNLAGAVHAARKDLKKLRSVIRLVRDGLGEDAYRRDNDRFAGAARMLGGARDAEAKLECVAKLRDRYEGEFPTRWSLGFIEELEHERDRIAAEGAAAEVDEAIAEIETGRRAIDTWELPGDGFELVEPGLRRAYRRGRNRFAELLDDPGDTEAHEWRKRVKDLWYQLRLLRRAWPAVVEATSEQAHELSSILGDHHDLAVLRGEVATRPDAFGGQSQSQVLELIARRQGELLDEATPLGRRLYAEKPRRLSGRIAVYWEGSSPRF